MRYRSLVFMLVAALSACGAPEEDKLRSVTSYEFASCDSVPAADATQLEAIKAQAAALDLPFSRAVGRKLRR